MVLASGEFENIMPQKVAKIRLHLWFNIGFDQYSQHTFLSGKKFFIFFPNKYTKFDFCIP